MKMNTSAIAQAVTAFCGAYDAQAVAVETLKPLVAGIKSRAELREIILVPLAVHYVCTLKPGQRGSSLVGDNAKTAQKALERLMAALLGAPVKAAIEIDFEEKDVLAMKALLKRLEAYAELEVDGKPVGSAKALALLVAQAKDRI
jgi:hypothetical protein